MFRYSPVEWYELQQEYVKQPETVTIKDFCFEVTGDDSLPMWEALEQKYREQEWDLIRDHFRASNGEHINLENSSAVKQALNDVQRVSRPLNQIAKTLKFCDSTQKKVEKALERAFMALDSASYALESPGEISKVVKDIAAVYQLTNGLERQVLGIKDPAELLKITSDSDSEMTIEELNEHLGSLQDSEIVMFLAELNRNSD